MSPVSDGLPGSAVPALTADQVADVIAYVVSRPEHVNLARVEPVSTTQVS